MIRAERTRYPYELTYRGVIIRATTARNILDLAQLASLIDAQKQRDAWRAWHAYWSGNNG